MIVTIMTKDYDVRRIKTDKIEFGWLENEMYAYFDGRSFPIELLKEVQND